jgi:hypothetical protein
MYFICACDCAIGHPEKLGEPKGLDEAPEKSTHRVLPVDANQRRPIICRQHQAVLRPVIAES